MLKKIIGSLVKATLLAVLMAFLVLISEVLVLGLSSGVVVGPSSFVTDHSQWPTVEGTVLYYGGEDREGYVDVAFTYEVNGESYRSTQSWHWEEHVYSNGDKVTVYYDQTNPRIAVIEPGKSQWAFETLLIIYVATVAFPIGTGLIVIWAWVSNVVSHKLESGREIAVWSWMPNRMCLWRIIGVTLGLILAWVPFQVKLPVFVVFAGVYLTTPVALAILLRAKSFQYWLGAFLKE